jgi:hypothetical protein
MADYLFIGAPTEQSSSRTATFKSLRDRTTPMLADVFELKVPETLKVGTQDSLVACVEDLHKVDTMAEQVTLHRTLLNSVIEIYAGAFPL